MGLFTDLSNRGLWTSYTKYVVAMEPPLDATSRRGMPVSMKRWLELDAHFASEQSRLHDEMQALVPDTVKQHDYLTRPPKPGTKVEAECPAVALPDGRWVRTWPFAPSNVALVRYMKAKGHPVPKHFKTKKDTTNEDELRRLHRATRDRLYGAVLEYRDVQTVRTNHLANWKPGADNRVHPTFYHTATGQLEARRPNTMNAPHHKDSGKLFRSVVEAEPGHTLLSFDYKGFHALYLAHLSGDTSFERLVRVDVHSYLTAHFLRLPQVDDVLGWPDADLREYLARVKKEHRHTRDAQVKHALLGYNNGMGYRKLFFQYRDFFDNQNQARRILELMDALFPKAAAYRRATQEQAHDQGYLISQFGCIRYFWEVKRWQGGEWSHGDDAEAAISFPQQNHAHCHLKDVMLKLDGAGLLDAYGFATPIHDDLTFHCPNELVDDALARVKAEMEAPSPVTGLSVGVEVKRGQRWSEMEVI